jgi:hypothetical protein
LKKKVEIINIRITRNVLTQQEKEKNMKRKVLSVIMAAAMAVSMMACGSSNGSADRSDQE